MSNSTRARRAGAIRSHELAKYHRLPAPDAAPGSQLQAPSGLRRTPSVSSSQASSPDTALTAYAQLTALRLNASRAMISVIDRETQYFIAESTKTLDLANTSKSEKEGDGLWLGCASVSAGGRLCEKTVELPVLPNGYPAFVVNDLSQDSRFNQLPFVTGPPFFKYYAGVPLTTNRGINIGSLFVIDDRVRPDLTQDQKVFMTVMSRNIMAHLELGREAEERRRGQTMSRGLARFVEGYPSLSDTVTGLGNVPKGSGSPGSETQTKEADSNSTKGDSLETTPLSGMNGTRIQNPRSSNESQATGLNTPSGGDAVDTTSSSSGSQTGRIHEEKGNSHRATFARAANLLRESLQLEGDGGVVCYDTSIGFSTPASIAETSSSGDDEQENEEKLSPGAFNDMYASKLHSFTSSIPPGTAEGRFERTAPILSFSTRTASSDKGDEVTSGLSFRPLPEKALAILVKRYPRGKLWSFDIGVLDSSSEDELSKYGNGTTKSPGLPEDRRARRRDAEAKLLLAHFPGVRQLLFTPLWDAGSARWYAGAFCFSFSNLIFSNESELSFCIAFGNCVMAEISRLNAIVSDQSKSDFIGSISHELRSPLHGILGSAEFLGETNCDTFQKSLVDTIDACGRTLLDTINHVLDFSKINSFEKNWRAAQKVRRANTSKGTSRSQTKSTQPGGPALLNIYAQTDVAAVCEEVVEGVFTGHIYADYSSLDITNVTAGARGKLSNRGLNTNKTLLGGQSPALEVDTKEQRVAVILDIKKHDWIFTTQPGALRRVIMNLFGNALKYTDHGWVRVSLEAEDAGGTQSNSTGAPDANAGMPTTVRLTVTDTGRGISPGYLRTRLYTPFAQENNLAPGTGLGLSIVRSIVNMLGGSIDVRSELGKGTEVRLTLPMIRSQGSETPISTPGSSSTVNRSQDDCISMLRDRAKNTRVALYGFDTNFQESNPSQSKSVQVHVEKTLSTYLTDWYDITVTPSSNLPSAADIIIVDEEHLDAFRAAYPAEPATRGGPALVCLCSNSTRYGQSCSWEGGSGIVEFISKPFGPYKLARALRSCLDKINSPIQDETKTSQVGVEHTEPSSNSSIEVILPDFERVTLETNDNKTPIDTLDDGKVQANGESTNARLAIGMGSTDGEELPDSRTDYPFPYIGDPLPRDETTTMRSEEGNIPRRKTVPLIPHIDAKHTSAVRRRGETASTSEPLHESQLSETESRQEKLPPRILLVDDNKINLRLLQTYMRKRHYNLVDSADDGGEAVRAFAKSDGYDIIFMDISMPVLNGFEATRAIRQIEDKRQSLFPENSHRPALIIALTGLASGRDQSEAFTSGVDLFMTKPVSFKEVGRLLDNWEANGRT